MNERSDGHDLTKQGDHDVGPAVIDLDADLGEGFGRWTLTGDEALFA
jgi:UPF0271 protein